MKSPVMVQALGCLCKSREKERATKYFLVHALGKALELTSQDYVAMSIIENSGLMDEARPTRVVVDTNELLKQLKEEQNES